MSKPSKLGKPTVVDVARRAGVSPSLVSRVLRGMEGYGTAETRAAIHRAAADLQYEPNAIARHLRTGQTAVAGVLFHHLVDFRDFAPVLRGIEQVLRPAGYGLMTSSTDGPEDEREALRLFRSMQVAGVIVVSSLRRMPSAHLVAAARDGLPLVAVNRWLETDGDGTIASPGPVPRVLWDNAGGARALAAHLLALGHRRLALVSDRSFANWPSAVGYQQRWEGICAAADAANCPEPARYMLPEVTSGAWMASGSTALLGITDVTAADTLHALAQQGIAVPDEVSLTGFTDSDVAAHLTPRLTTARMPFEAAGKAAAETLLRLIAGESAPAMTVLPCPLVERESCAPALARPATWAYNGAVGGNVQDNRVRA